MVSEKKIQQPIIVDSLLKKMDGSPGFASLGGAVKTISSLIDNDGNNRQIVAAVLRDPALTSKLLNIANSSRYPRGACNICRCLRNSHSINPSSFSKFEETIP